MVKRLITLLMASMLVGGLLAASPARAEGEPGSTGGVLPDSPNIVDDAGDANMHSAVTGVGGGLTQTGADILSVWFTNDATNLYVHVQNTTNVRAESLTFITYVGPATGTDCMQLRMTTEGEGVDPFSSISLSGDCGTGVTAYGPLLEEVGPDDTTILTGTYPLADVQKVATSGLLAEPDTLVGYNLRDASARAGIIDDTEVGTDYVVASGAPSKPTKPVKPTHPSTPVKKGCTKGKGKKKGCTKPNPGKGTGCAPVTPSPAGAGKPTITLTPAATEAAPLEQKLTLAQSTADIPLVGGDPTTDAFNVQVDTPSGDGGLYALIEFPQRNDYDLDLEYPDGSYAARSHAFNTVIELNDQEAPIFGGISSTGHGGESTASSEKLVGIKTADCGGYTLEVTNFLSQGGEVSIKLWLGEIKNDPQAPGEEMPS
jgi:hypothetical protein